MGLSLNNLNEYRRDFSQILINLSLQIRTRNPFIDQKKFIRNQMNKFLEETTGIVINNLEDLKRVKRYLKKSSSIHSGAQRIMGKENKKSVSLRSESFFSKEAEFSIRKTTLLNQIESFGKYLKEQSILEVLMPSSIYAQEREKINGKARPEKSERLPKF